MKSIGRIFLTGILTVLPILATIYLVVWLFAAVERFLGKQLLFLMPDEYYRAWACSLRWSSFSWSAC